MGAISGFALCTCAGQSQAGVVDSPYAKDEFYSSFDEYLILKASYTGMGSDIVVHTTGKDFPGTMSTVYRELNAHSGFFSTDTIDTEFVSMHLAGSVIEPPTTPFTGLPVQFKIGAGNGFLPSLGRSPGQVAEKPPTPQNGELDVFPAPSVFDLFIDVWVDINTDDIVDVGEVLRNFDDSLRMSNDVSSLPPTAFVDVYHSVGSVSVLDPLLGEFGATVSTDLIDFYVVNLDGTNSGILAAQLDPTLLNEHIVTPEPSSLAAFAGLFGVFFRRRALAWVKRRPQHQRV